MARAQFGWSKVDGVLTAISKMLITLTPCRRKGEGAQTAKGKEHRDVGEGASEERERRQITLRFPRQTVLYPGGSLKGERMKSGWQICGGEEDTSKAKT